MLGASLRHTRTPSPALLPLFRSENQLRLLAEIYVRAGQARTLTELAEATGVPLATVSREVARLEEAGLVRSARRGRFREVDADPTLPFFADLRSLLLKTMGPLPVLRDALAGVPGIEEAWIVGSWAARHEGEAGPPPRDVDVLVLGEPEVAAVHDACQRAERELRLEVNPVVRTAAAWRTETGGFLDELRRRPRVAIIGPEAA